MRKLALLAFLAVVGAETVLIHPEEGMCIRADSPSERELLSLGRCSTSGEDVRAWDIDEADPTLIRLHGTDICLTGGVHNNWDGELEFDPEDGDHAVLRACPSDDEHRIPDGYAWMRYEGEGGLHFKLDLTDDWFLHASFGAAVWISNEEPSKNWTLEAVDGDGDGDDGGDVKEAVEGKQRVPFWEAVGDVLQEAL